jgi:hypothetical protein
VRERHCGSYPHSLSTVVIPSRPIRFIYFKILFVHCLSPFARANTIVKKSRVAGLYFYACNTRPVLSSQQSRANTIVKKSRVAGLYFYACNTRPVLSSQQRTAGSFLRARKTLRLLSSSLTVVILSRPIRYIFFKIRSVHCISPFARANTIVKKSRVAGLYLRIIHGQYSSA